LRRCARGRRQSPGFVQNNFQADADLWPAVSNSDIIVVRPRAQNRRTMDQSGTSSYSPTQRNVAPNPPPSHSGCRFAQLSESPAPSPEPTAVGSLAGDILYGAEAIAKFMYGSKDFRRSVYNLIENRRIPHFRIGASLCVRKSVLMAWIANQETLR
jgi:hypothetical protein